MSMITERTIVDLVERLEDATKAILSKEGRTQWVKDSENLVYDVRSAIDKNDYGFENLVLKEDYEELKRENDTLHDEIIELEEKISDLED